MLHKTIIKRFLAIFMGLAHLYHTMTLLLRVGLSPLRYHKKCHNFIDTPSDNCSCDQRPEDIDHFLFSCPLYAACRITLTTDVIKILQKYNLII